MPCCDLSARGCLGPANNQLSSDVADEILHARGITWIPDVMASAGGVIHGVCREELGLDVTATNRRIDAIGQAVDDLLDTVAAERLTPLQTAQRLAQQRLARRPEGTAHS